jgi:hypothetical protein
MALAGREIRERHFERAAHLGVAKADASATTDIAEKLFAPHITWCGPAKRRPRPSANWRSKAIVSHSRS